MIQDLIKQASGIKEELDYKEVKCFADVEEEEEELDDEYQPHGWFDLSFNGFAFDEVLLRIEEDQEVSETSILEAFDSIDFEGLSIEENLLESGCDLSDLATLLGLYNSHLIDYSIDYDNSIIEIISLAD